MVNIYGEQYNIIIIPIQRPLFLQISIIITIAVLTISILSPQGDNT